MVREQEAVEVERMNATHENWDTAGWRQYQSEYTVHFPAEAVDALRDLDGQLEIATELLISPLGTLAGSQVALMTGPAGIGKTYLALGAAARRLQRGLPSIVMHGRWFNASPSSLRLARDEGNPVCCRLSTSSVTLEREDTDHGDVSGAGAGCAEESPGNP